MTGVALEQARWNRRVGTGALEWARIHGMLHETIQDGNAPNHESARFWLAQPGPPKTRSLNLEKGKAHVRRRAPGVQRVAAGQGISGKR